MSARTPLLAFAAVVPLLLAACSAADPSESSSATQTDAPPSDVKRSAMDAFPCDSEPYVQRTTEGSGEDAVEYWDVFIVTAKQGDDPYVVCTSNGTDWVRINEMSEDATLIIANGSGQKTIEWAADIGDNSWGIPKAITKSKDVKGTGAIIRPPQQGADRDKNFVDQVGSFSGGNNFVGFVCGTAIQYRVAATLDDFYKRAAQSYMQWGPKKEEKNFCNE